MRERLTVAAAAKPAVAKPVGRQQLPRIAGAGGVHALPSGVGMSAMGVVHRVLIDATTGDTTASGTGRHLDAAARAVNLYALAKVPPKNLKVAVGVHGKATPLVLNDACYRQQFGKPNPDAAFVAQLHQAGVEIFVCGQALSHQGHAVTDVRDDVRVSVGNDQIGRPAGRRLRSGSLVRRCQGRPSPSASAPAASVRHDTN